jgi:hypothetical protein
MFYILIFVFTDLLFNRLIGLAQISYSMQRLVFADKHLQNQILLDSLNLADLLK